jgi:hypothetical protein
MMRKAAAVTGIFVLALFMWTGILVAFYHDAASATRWLSLLPPSLQQSFVFHVLNKEFDEDTEYEKVVLLEAWEIDVETHAGKLELGDVSKAIPYTSVGDSPLEAPRGLIAARIIIASRNCTAVGLLLAHYRSKPGAILNIVDRLNEKGICPDTVKMLQKH